jgi:hypothetical protein
MYIKNEWFKNIYENFNCLLYHCGGYKCKYIFPNRMLKVYLYAQTYIDLRFVYNHSKLYIGNMF